MSELSADRARFAAAPVARLASVTVDGNAHIVPVIFALANETIYTGVDGKPKSTLHLRRLANIAANPNVAVLVDHYDDDWSQLWWVRADGTAVTHQDGTQANHGRRLLRAKYPQYQSISLDGPIIAITISRWNSWTAS